MPRTRMPTCDREGQPGPTSRGAAPTTAAVSTGHPAKGDWSAAGGTCLCALRNLFQTPRAPQRRLPSVTDQGAPQRAALDMHRVSVRLPTVLLGYLRVSQRNPILQYTGKRGCAVENQEQAHHLHRNAHRRTDSAAAPQHRRGGDKTSRGGRPTDPLAPPSEPELRLW